MINNDLFIWLFVWVVACIICTIIFKRRTEGFIIWVLAPLWFTIGIFVTISLYAIRNDLSFKGFVIAFFKGAREALFEYD